MNFAELADDIAHKAEQALFLTRQMKQIDERVANLYADADPDGIVASAPGVGPVISAVIAGRIAIRTGSRSWPRSAPTPASARLTTHSS
jgi:transposase